jgi:hypothetical protein
MSNAYYIVVISIGAGLLLFTLKYGARHTMVFIFHHSINRLARDWSIRHLDEITAGRENNAYDWFISKAPNYWHMLFSKKPVTLEAWFDKELIEKIKN